MDQRQLAMKANQGELMNPFDNKILKSYKKQTKDGRYIFTSERKAVSLKSLAI